MSKTTSLAGPPELREFWQSVFDYPRTPGNFRPWSSPEEQRIGPVDSISTQSGVVVTPDRALRLSAVWACVGLRSDLLSSLPCILRDEGKRPLTGHPLYTILHDQANADMSAADFWQFAQTSVDLWGNAYARIDRNVLGDVIALTPLRPEKMTVRRNGNGAISYLYEIKGGVTREYRQGEIFHLKGFSVDGLVGLSPLRYAAEVMGNQTAANDAATREFRNGLKVGGFLKTGAQVLTQDQRDRLRANLGEFSSPENAAKWMVLEANMEPVSANAIRMNPADAQLLESRYYGIEEICRAYRTPPQLIGHTNKASSWASSLENTNLGFLTYTFRPILTKNEQAISMQLLRPEERGKIKPKFSIEGLLRADSAARANFYRTMVAIGAYSVNDVLELEDRPPVDGGDVRTVQLNLLPLEQVGKQPAAEPKPAPPAEETE